MEHFRRWAWPLKLCCLGAAAWLVGRTGAEILRALLLPPLEDSAGASTPTRATRLEGTPLDEVAAGRLAGQLGLPTRGGRDTQAPGEEPRADEPARSTLRVRLLGTLVATPAQSSRGAFWELDSGRVQTLGVGATLLGARIEAIERTRAIVLHQNRRELIDLAAPIEPVAPRMPSSPQLPSSRAGERREPLPTLRQLSEHVYELQRNDVDAQLADGATLLTQARLLPVLQGSNPVGWRLVAIVPGSLYAQIGLVNGDVLRRVNGFDLSSPERGLELLAKLREAPRIEVELERSGQVVRKSYLIR